ncbi:PEP-utilizing family enzyme [Tahibacter aquaticus]|uniref:PEP-utilizing family enzyme n=1 Tax=Tahibacter aquaticus TaxID=520092 RepID=A0A4R6Z6T2_9GAMM|nr:PEP-utilizing enzyme [Tahibacter aquaticus]TDR47473.1 PEP-utilizing family enzyme [Tahibacter aquaticus]
MSGAPAAAAGAAMSWSGKAGTLLRLAPLLRHSEVPAGLVLSWREWQQRGNCLLRLRQVFGGAAVAVRSSQADEDSSAHSQAGRYLTRLDVASADAPALAAAIDAVFASYGSARSQDEVFVQAMVQAEMAVVAATHAVEDGADYYAFSLAAGARTDAVTRGDVAVQTVYLAHEAPSPQRPDLALLHRALLELREHCGAQPLEAELVLCGQRVLLLQVRPLVLRGSPRSGLARRRLLAVEQRQLLQATAGCAGQRRVLALMPDWNTAELLGSHPRPLALDVFRLAIADAAWQRARRALGYRPLRQVSLLQPLAGRPYIDVRASANSLLPQALADSTAARLADAWQERLLAAPQLHDKYEFAIAQTCVDFDFDAQWRERYAGVLAPAELAHYRDTLRSITARCLAPQTLAAGLARLRRLEQPAHADADADALAVACRRLPRDGGLAFALIARLAFVYEALVRSAVARGALQPERLLLLQRSCRSVTRDFLRASGHAHAFGFLRAGTFEITTPSLGQRELTATVAEAAAVEFAPTPAERRALDRLLGETGYRLEADALLHGYCRTREAREYAKYRLSAAVSQLLEQLAAHGASRGLDRDSLSWLELDRARAASPSAASLRAAANRSAHAIDAALRLPTVFDPRCTVQQVEIAAGTPTFVGNGRAAAPLVVVDMQTRPAAVPLRAVLAIASADPGYDWIFARQPAGLITAFGGPNSHMAIRCAELGVPAILGLGWERWQRLSQAKLLEIDTQALAVTPWTDV